MLATRKEEPKFWVLMRINFTYDRTRFVFWPVAIIPSSLEVHRTSASEADTAKFSFPVTEPIFDPNDIRNIVVKVYAGSYPLSGLTYAIDPKSPHVQVAFDGMDTTIEKTLLYDVVAPENPSTGLNAVTDPLFLGLADSVDLNFNEDGWEYTVEASDYTSLLTMYHVSQDFLDKTFKPKTQTIKDFVTQILTSAQKNANDGLKHLYGDAASTKGHPKDAEVEATAAIKPMPAAYENYIQLGAVFGINSMTDPDTKAAVEETPIAQLNPQFAKKIKTYKGKTYWDVVTDLVYTTGLLCRIYLDKLIIIKPLSGDEVSLSDSQTMRTTIKHIKKTITQKVIKAGYKDKKVLVKETKKIWVPEESSADKLLPQTTEEQAYKQWFTQKRSALQRELENLRQVQKAPKVANEAFEPFAVTTIGSVFNGCDISTTKAMLIIAILEKDLAGRGALTTNPIQKIELPVARALMEAINLNWGYCKKSKQGSKCSARRLVFSILCAANGGSDRAGAVNLSVFLERVRRVVAALRDTIGAADAAGKTSITEPYLTEDEETLAQDANAAPNESAGHWKTVSTTTTKVKKVKYRIVTTETKEVDVATTVKEYLLTLDDKHPSKKSIEQLKIVFPTFTVGEDVLEMDVSRQLGTVIPGAFQVYSYSHKQVYTGVYPENTQEVYADIANFAAFGYDPKAPRAIRVVPGLQSDDKCKKAAKLLFQAALRKHSEVKITVPVLAVFKANMDPVMTFDILPGGLFLLDNNPLRQFSEKNAVAPYAYYIKATDINWDDGGYNVEITGSLLVPEVLE